jgi:hypothetical protein
MNVIQQEAIAKSLGMQVDEMGDMLYKQKVLDEVGGQTLKNLRERAKVTKDINLQAKVDALEQGILSGKSFEESEKAASAQEKFNQALEQAKEAFTDFVDGGFLDQLADAVKAFADMVLSEEDREKAATKKAEKIKSSEEYKKFTPEQQRYIDEQQKIAEDQAGFWSVGGKLDQFFFGKDVASEKDINSKAASEKLSQIASKGFEGKTTNIKKDEEPITNQQSSNMVYKDFTIRSLPEDTLVGMGGTALGRTDEMVKLLIQQNQHLDKQNTLLASINNKETNIVMNGTKLGTAMNTGAFKTA